MILYEYGSNSILTGHLKNNTIQELVRLQTRIIQYLPDRGLKPSALCIENKCPKALRNFFRANSVNFQLCPSNDHRTNQVEKAIDTWKFHFLAGLSGVDPNFPLRVWCCLLPKSTQTLNLLRRSWINPILSAEAQLNGEFNCNHTPMATPQKKFLIHETPQQMRTWDFCGKEGWYIGKAQLHYRCYRIYTF